MPNMDSTVTGACVVCTQAIYHDETAIVHRSAELRCAYGTCEACRIPHITVEIGSGKNSTSVSLLTDWKRSEVAHFWSRENISSDDVLMIHESLKSPSLEAAFINSSTS